MISSFSGFVVCSRSPASTRNTTTSSTSTSSSSASASGSASRSMSSQPNGDTNPIRRARVRVACDGPGFVRSSRYIAATASWLDRVTHRPDCDSSIAVFRPHTFRMSSCRHPSHSSACSRRVVPTLETNTSVVSAEGVIGTWSGETASTIRCVRTCTCSPFAALLIVVADTPEAPAMARIDQPRPRRVAMWLRTGVPSTSRGLPWSWS